MPLPQQTHAETSPASDPVQAEIDRLRESFVRRSLGNLAILEGLLDDRERLAEMMTGPDAGLIQLAHTLAGSAGIFGFREIGDAAAELEMILRQPEYTEVALQRALAALVSEISKLR